MSLITSAKFSVIIPVFNSEKIILDTIKRTCAFFEQNDFDIELILINDGSKDNSWKLIREKAFSDDRIKAINLLHNYGQHTAIFAGLTESTGDYAITMDDDLQNPPEEIIHLIEKASQGYDLVMGKFRKKQHAGYRRLGSILIRTINQRIFHQPKDLTLSNFRMIRRDVIDRVVNYRTSYPYITGLVLMFSANPANVEVEHRSRAIGKSNYTFIRIAKLVMRVLFNYSSLPLRVISTMGMFVAIGSFFLGTFYLVKGLIVGSTVQGWTTVVVLLSFFNAVSLLLVSMLGEYIIRLLTQSSDPLTYYVREVIND